MRLQDLISKIGSKEGFPGNLDDYLEDFLPNTLLKSETLQQAYGISVQQMEEMYAQAYAYYQQDEMASACNLFRFLVILNPFQFRYWMGLGSSQYLLSQFEKALHSYAVAALLDSNDPYPHFHAYECYDKMQERAEATKALELAEIRAKEHPLYGPLREEIQQLKAAYV